MREQRGARNPGRRVLADLQLLGGVRSWPCWIGRSWVVRALVLVLVGERVQGKAEALGLSPVVPIQTVPELGFRRRLLVGELLGPAGCWAGLAFAERWVWGCPGALGNRKRCALSRCLVLGSRAGRVVSLDLGGGQPLARAARLLAHG